MITFIDESNLPANKDIPFGNLLHQLFFCPDDKQNEDYPIHGPNVIRFVAAFSELDLTKVAGLLAGNPAETRQAANMYSRKKELIFAALDASTSEKEGQIFQLLKIGALYHDIGKVIRRANHPQIGLNLLRHMDPEESRKLILELGEGNQDTGRNRFALVCSIAQHHDKFGVVSTGEGGLPIFSDILYFTSDKDSEEGIRKNVTAVMLLCLADIAAVALDSTKERAAFKEACRIAMAIGKHRDAAQPDENACQELTELGTLPEHCLGLRRRKLEEILLDWDLLLKKCKEVQGDRGQLRTALISEESNPARTIIRMRRLLLESAETTRCDRLTKFIDKTTVENALVGNLGSHQFEYFCSTFALVVKLDYGLKFFQSVTRACVRHSLAMRNEEPQQVEIQEELNTKELEQLNDLTFTSDEEIERIATRLTTLFVKIIQKLVSRYAGVLDSTASNNRRFGFQLRDLTGDKKIWQKILSLICKEPNSEHIGLTWMADEVTIWSMD